VVDIAVGYHEDLSRVQRVLREVAHGMWEDEDFKGIIIEEPEVTGVELFNTDSVTLRVLLKTAPMEQWAVARELRQRVKARFDHEGIELPLPQRVVWHREERASVRADERAEVADEGGKPGGAAATEA
jgi:small-conductance mechanosensitive channel